MRVVLLVTLFIFSFAGCSDSDDVTPPENVIEQVYFPAINSSEWKTVEPSDLGWNESELTNLYSFLDQNNTKAFIILKSGKIVIEKYWGNDDINSG